MSGDDDRHDEQISDGIVPALRTRIAELETGLRTAIALIRTDDHPTRQGMANQLEKLLSK